MEDWSGRKVFAEYASFPPEPESGTLQAAAGALPWQRWRLLHLAQRQAVHHPWTETTTSTQVGAVGSLAGEGPGKGTDQSPASDSQAWRTGPSQGPAAQLCSHPLKVYSSALCPQIPFSQGWVSVAFTERGRYRGPRMTHWRPLSQAGHCVDVHGHSLPEPRAGATQPRSKAAPLHAQCLPVPLGLFPHLGMRTRLAGGEVGGEKVRGMPAGLCLGLGRLGL